MRDGKEGATEGMQRGNREPGCFGLIGLGAARVLVT